MESGQYQRATRGKVPAWFAKQPPVSRGDEIYLTAFSLLATDRQFPGSGIGPIPWTAAFQYGHALGLGRRMALFFAQVILLLDGHYRAHLISEQEKDRQRQERRDRRAKARDGNGRQPRRRRKR